MHTTLERAPMPLMLVDSDGTIAYAPSSIDDFGYVAEELIGHRLLDSLTPMTVNCSAAFWSYATRRAGRLHDRHALAPARRKLCARRARDPRVRRSAGSVRGGVVVGLRSLP